MSDRIERLFPNLLNDGYSITSPQTADYNCIAWASGDDQKFWWPDPLNIGYWPSNVPCSLTLDAFVCMFESFGYAVCPNHEHVHEEGYEKIAIYVSSDGKPTHASRQLTSGRWTSKLGRLEDIEHSVEGVEGSQYGTVAVFMKRTVS